MVFFEYLHNEYRQSFVELHIKFCEYLLKDPYLGHLLVSKGVSCPVPVGPVSFKNMTLPSSVPYKWPFEKCRIDGNVTVTATGESIMKYSFYALFVEDLKTATKKHKQ